MRPTAVLLVLAVLAATALASGTAVPWLKVPKGFKVELYASGLPNARSMAYDPSTNSLFVGSMNMLDGQYIQPSSVYRIDTSAKPIAGNFVNGSGFSFSGSPRAYTEVLTELQFPNGVAMVNNTLFVGTLTDIWRVEFPNGVTSTPVPTSIFSNPIPPIIVSSEERARRTRNARKYSARQLEQMVESPDHCWKYLGEFNGQLAVAIGSPCNTCNVSRDGCLLDYGDKYPCIYGSINVLPGFASAPTSLTPLFHGVRNSVGFDYDNDMNLWWSDNGRDQYMFPDQNNWPPDELNVFLAGSNSSLSYGFPACFGKNVPDDTAGFNPTNSCATYTPDSVDLPPHGAALGVRFYRARAFPSQYREKVFVALHGSWDRTTTPTGYEVVVVDPIKGSVTPFLTGFLQFPNGTAPSSMPLGPSIYAVGRPVDILLMPDGSLLVSDDLAGCIYRITYNNNEHSKDLHILYYCLIGAGALLAILFVIAVIAISVHCSRANRGYEVINETGQHSHRR